VRGQLARVGKGHGPGPAGNPLPAGAGTPLPWLPTGRLPRLPSRQRPGPRPGSVPTRIPAVRAAHARGRSCHIHGRLRGRCRTRTRWDACRRSGSGANSSITLARERPLGFRRGGVGGPGAERYLRTVLRSSPVSRAISNKVVAPDSNKPRRRRSSNQRCGSKTTVDHLRRPPTKQQTAEQQGSRHQQLSLFTRTWLGTFRCTPTPASPLSTRC
jgi:hypothetical protein